MEEIWLNGGCHVDSSVDEHFDPEFLQEQMAGREEYYFAYEQGRAGTRSRSRLHPPLRNDDLREGGVVAMLRYELGEEASSPA